MPLGRKVKRVERGTWKALFEMLMNETKKSILIFSKGKRSKTCRGRHFSGSELRFCYFRERVCIFSPRSRAIGQSKFFGRRRKAVLSGEGNAWAPFSGVFDKLCEAGVSSYLFYSWFKCFIDVCVGLRL